MADDKSDSIVRRLARERAVAVRALRQIVSGRREPQDEPNRSPAFAQQIAIKALQEMSEYPSVQGD